MAASAAGHRVRELRRLRTGNLYQLRRRMRSELLRVRQQRVDAVGGRVARGLVARDRQQQHEHVELELGQTVTVDLAPCGAGGMLMRQKWAERNPELYSPFADGTPVFCRGCKALKAAFNKRCGAEVWRTEIAPDCSVLTFISTLQSVSTTPRSD